MIRQTTTVLVVLSLLAMFVAQEVAEEALTDPEAAEADNAKNNATDAPADATPGSGSDAPAAPEGSGAEAEATTAKSSTAAVTIIGAIAVFGVAHLL
ncbi:Anther-specific protein BCP1-like [Caenorhabditis elegans]|uniref:Anther-specific protein BCP1-like n=1 Tax=Caenorhabditis elegans TaxID=6239 RepID=O01851_CAEEL|nr:Anther-specific protein BCP1-like [Caenorhabditis elegans]CCD70401.1 Anther-specific protein BCP1-like [Caenorhabditis elegans]|eukprot:NP_491024.1 MS Related Protein [Caenorhabditis elegans]